MPQYSNIYFNVYFLRLPKIDICGNACWFFFTTFFSWWQQRLHSNPQPLVDEPIVLPLYECHKILIYISMFISKIAKNRHLWQHKVVFLCYFLLSVATAAALKPSTLG
jgi:hypothetical protein